MNTNEENLKEKKDGGGVAVISYCHFQLQVTEKEDSQVKWSNAP